MTARAVICLAAIVLFAGVSSCGERFSPEKVSTGLGLKIIVPEDIVPPGFSAALFPQQATAVTSEGELTIETKGRLWIEVRSASEIIASPPLLDEDDQSAELIDLKPGSGYTLGVYAGIFGESPLNTQEVNGVIRFAAVQTISIPPDETVFATVTLVRCEDIEDDLPERQRRVCDSDFGTELAPPAPPDIFPLPSRTGCAGTDRDTTLVVAGNKVTQTIVIDNNGDTLVSDPEAHWLWNPHREVFGQTKLQRSLQTAWLIDDQIRSDAVATNYDINSGALCFNPYLSTDPDISQDDGNIELVWITGSDDPRTLQALVLEAGTTISGTLNNEQMNAMLADAFAAPASQDTTPPTLTFSLPATATWDLYLFVQDADAGSWRAEGAFRYDEAWLNAQDHPAAP